MGFLKTQVVRFLTASILGVVVFIGVSMPLLAEDINGGFCSGDGAQTEICATSQKNDESAVFGSNGLITKIVQTLTYLAGAISVLVIMIAGFRYIISAGDSNAVQGAKNTILYALVGLTIATFAQVIVSFVLMKIG